MPTQSPTQQTLLAENAELRARLEEAEEMLRAIRNGEVDALVVESSGPDRKSLRCKDWTPNRGRKRLSPSPPSEPGVRFSRDGLSSQLFPHRDWRANLWASDIVNSPRSAKKAFGHCL